MLLCMLGKLSIAEPCREPLHLCCWLYLQLFYYETVTLKILLKIIDLSYFLFGYSVCTMCPAKSLSLNCPPPNSRLSAVSRKTACIYFRLLRSKPSLGFQGPDLSLQALNHDTEKGTQDAFMSSTENKTLRMLKSCPILEQSDLCGTVKPLVPCKEGILCRVFKRMSNPTHFVAFSF